MLSVVAIAALIVTAWFAGEGTIRILFERLNAGQEMPPMWLMAPKVAGEYLLFWAVMLMLIVLTITKVSPRPRPWSRVLVVGILSVLTVRYLVWRSLSTLNLSDPLNGVFSLGLFFLELLMLGGGILQLVLLLRVKDRRAEADRASAMVRDWLGQSPGLVLPNLKDRPLAPSVDVLIPTYNEPPFILRRTIIGCQALDYEPKTIYLLDDQQRLDVRALAAELGCHYIARSDNRHAKAGNLNHALSYTNSELIVVFDADFIPTKNFLTRTVGFFQDPQVGLVQTPQTFYNADPIARNLGLEHILTPEEEVFYRQIQPLRDAVGGVICAGTSFVVRRSALVESGCFFTGALSEDYYTGIRLAAKGYHLVYLNEKLSAGLAAENISAQALQRLRWARGTLQAFFVSANPLTIRGLRPMQRLAHLEGIWHWFTSLSRVGFLLIPLAYSFLGVIPVRATTTDVLYYFLPYYLVQLTTFSWLNHRSRSAFLSDLYTLVLAFPLALTVIQVMLNPFGQEFRVTPKGTVSDRFQFNWQLALPLIIVFIATAVSLWTNLGHSVVFSMAQPTMTPDAVEQMKGISLGWVWSAYNLLVLAIALLILIDAPRPHSDEWFDLQRPVRLKVGETLFWGFTTKISEGGAEVALTQKNALTMSDAVQLDLLDDHLSLQGQIIHTGFENEFPTVQIRFDSLPLDQERRFIELLFCRPGQWRSRCSPGELQSLWLLVQILLKPRVIFDRSTQIRTISVAQV
ncbi:MAG: glycosyltransferase [Myxacorys chilensis ATA2-1-KO14]|jgi:cellulose synthase (UDP-forming)|nr:glycosyltransferase [Myxacorys chilensis ATA2-1-KO14]